jgi:hypothetical protein
MLLLLQYIGVVPAQRVSWQAAVAMASNSCCIAGNRSSAFIRLPQMQNNHVDYYIIKKILF